MTNVMPSLKVTATSERAAETGTAGAVTGSVGGGEVTGKGGGAVAFEADVGVAGEVVAPPVDGDVAVAEPVDLGAGVPLGFRMASITVSWTCALESRITSGADRLNAVLELRIWLRMIATETFASTIWMMLSFVNAWSVGVAGTTGAAFAGGVAGDG